MLTNPGTSLFSSPVLFFSKFIFIGCLLALAVNVRAGFLYALNQQNGTANQIHGFSVNESTGALTLLGGFPVSSGGNGIASTGSRQLTIDRANQRLYVINDGSNTISGFSINPATGALTPLPFSPIALPAGTWATISVHPSGSPLIVGNTDAAAVVASFKITATTATAVPGSPFSTGTARNAASAFSRDGNFVYAGGSVTNFFAGFSVNASTGVLTALPGSPFDSGAAAPSAYATDSKGRIFMTSPLSSSLRAFTTSGGVPTGVTGNPFASGLSLAADGVLHPNEKFYYAADLSLSQVGAFQVSGDGAATTLAPVAGSPFNSSGSQTNALAFNASGGFLFAINNSSRNISTYSVNASTGVLTFGNVQVVNALGTTGNLTGVAYQPTVFTVTNTNDSGGGSLRQAVLNANAGGGVIVFDPALFAAPQTISLTGGQILILSNVEIVGIGAHLLTVRNAAAAGTNSRAFTNNGTSSVLSGLTISGGNTTTNGGGVSNFAPQILTLRSCLITGNIAGASGGGIRNAGTLNLINSTVSGNTSNAAADAAAGIDSDGAVLNVINSTVSGNSIPNAVNPTGGIRTGVLTTIVNSTITNNFANGTGTVVGGVNVRSGTTAVMNSIIAGNRSGAGTRDVGAVGTLVSLGFNLVGNTDTVTAFNQTGDQTGTGASPLNPGLVKVLALNGGNIPTHALLPNSPAVDKGNNFNFTTDARGFNRPFDSAAIPNAFNGADIGAFERRAFEPNVTAPFDFDSDNKTDISIFRPSDGSWWYLRSSDNSFNVFSFGVSSDKLAPGDFTGDGKEDIAVFRPSNGFWFIQRSEDNSFFSFPFGASGDIPAPSDYDGDGKTDAAVFRPSTGEWFILNSGGGTTIVTFGTPEDKPVTADYDGDGKSDIAIFRPSDGSWWYLQSSNGQFRVYRFGVATDKPLPGDYTGDGKADIAIFRPSNGFWFIQRSEDNSFFSFPFGAVGDTPVPGDYDGDGKFDAAIFRSSEANWYVQRSTAGTLIQQFGITTDRPVPNAFVP